MPVTLGLAQLHVHYLCPKDILTLPINTTFSVIFKWLVSNESPCSTSSSMPIEYRSAINLCTFQD